MAKRFKQRVFNKHRAAPDARGMRGWRSRVRSSGKLRRKRADTKITTLEKTYHKHLGKHSFKLKTLLKRKHRRSLKRLIK